MTDETFAGFEPSNTTPVPDVCWICQSRLWHWRKERPDGLCNRCSGELLKIVIRHRKRAKIKGTDATLTLAEWIEKIRDSQGLCYYCNGPIGYNALTLEHLIPIAKGGGTTAENCVPACMTCNWEQWFGTREVGV